MRITYTGADVSEEHLDRRVVKTARGSVRPVSAGKGGSASGAAAADPAPRSVVRGAKSQVSIDWLRGSAPACMLTEAQRILSEFLGVALESAGGRFNLRASVRGGASGVYFDPSHDASFIVVDIAGSDLCGLPQDEQIRLVRCLHAMGLSVTRFDIAVDWRGPGVDLVEAVQSWCEAGKTRLEGKSLVVLLRATRVRAGGS